MSFKKRNFAKVAPAPINADTLESMISCNPICQVDLFRAKKGYEQTKLRFLTTIVGQLDVNVTSRVNAIRQTSEPNISREIQKHDNVRNTLTSKPEKSASDSDFQIHNAKHRRPKTFFDGFRLYSGTSSKVQPVNQP